MTTPEQIANDQLRLPSRLDPKQTEQFLNWSTHEFIQAGEWGVHGANDRYDIVYRVWKYLTAEQFRVFGKECLRLKTNEIDVMLRLGQRRAKAGAAVKRLSASAELYVVTQSTEGFDRFLAFASEWDCYSGDSLNRVVAHSYLTASGYYARGWQQSAETKNEP